MMSRRGVWAEKVLPGGAGGVVCLSKGKAPDVCGTGHSQRASGPVWGALITRAGLAAVRNH